jgi:hypothetical protein
MRGGQVRITLQQLRIAAKVRTDKRKLTQQR